jgi:1,4-dihydroxy-2-naphthoyl-CoA hydrolase
MTELARDANANANANGNANGTAPRRTGPALDPTDAGAFLTELGLEFGEIGPTRVTAHLDLGPRHHTPWGIVHGGVYSTAVESLASIGASAAVRERGMVAVGLTNTTHFLRAVAEGRVYLEAIALSQGGSQQLWQVDVTDQNGKRVAHGEVRLQNVPGQPRPIAKETKEASQNNA